MFSKLFGKQEQGTSSMNAKNDAPLFQERPWVCMIDIDQSVVDAMKESGFNSINSTFGQVIELPTKKLRQSVLCKLPSDGIPDNLHEFDIAVIDLKDRKNTAYEPIDSELSESKIAKQTFIECEYPQTLFDPRPVVGTIFQKVFYDEHKKTITIVFASSNEVIEYNLVDLTSDGYRPRSTGIRYEVYSFLPSTPYMNNKKGFETKVVANSQLSDFLEKYNRDFEYDIVFSHPVIRNGTDLLEDPNFIPLILNRSDEIVSYVQVVDSAMIWVFPQLKNKESFLLELFQKYLPDISPHFFPFSTQFVWLNDDLYRLPNELTLISEKQALKNEYVEKISEIEQKIDKNRSEYQFLHDLITETGDRLVKSVEHYFRWLGFNNVINCDESHPQRKEEDLQIPHKKGLLVIEVKGIGGTSKDSECSQISKIKHRREKERNAFDVFALYLVNSERYLPPKNRQNPPFTDQQIADAQDDERGLLTTYELFTLYYAIEAGIISKEDACNALFEFGRIVFKPSNSTLVGKPTEIHHNNTVGIFNLQNVVIRKNDELIVFESGRYCKIRVVSIMDQNEDVEEASNCEVGIRFTSKISTTSEFWKPTIQ